MMAITRPEISWPKMRFSPKDAGCTPGGRCRIIGSLFAAARASPSWTPFTRSAWTLSRRMRSKRWIWAGPAWKSTSATLFRVVVPPPAVGRRMERTRFRSERAASGRRTRIGTRWAPSLNLATLASMSPSVATRATEAMVSIETPSRAA